MTYSRILLFLILSVPLSPAGLTISAEPTANFSPKGKTKLAPGNAKGQTFALEKASQFEGVVLPISNLERASDLRLEVYATEGQTPTGKPLLSASGDFPENLPNKTSIQVTFAEPITLSPGSYALLIQSDDSKFQLPLNPSDPYPAGQFIRRNASTKEAWKPGATAATDLPLRLLGSTEFSIPLPSERTKAPETPKTPVTLTHHQNPEFTPISLASLPQKPNLIVCMVDDLGWNQIGVPQATWNTHPDIYETPNLARLAEEGLCFTAAYAQPNCAPTRAAMLSGQYPARIHNQVYVVNGLNRHGRGGISKDEAQFVGPNQEEDIAPEAVTIAEALKENGYATAHIGKYHVGGHEGGESTLPENVGFDINIGGSSQGHQPTCFASESKDGEWQFKGLGRGHFDRFGSPYTTDYVENHGFSHSLVGTAKHVSDAVADAMEETIQSFVATKDPFYLQLHPYAVHGPVRSRPDLLERFEGDHLAGFVHSIDLIMGRLLRLLEDPNLDGDPSDSIASQTIVFFTSDNGGTHRDNLPLRGKKGMLTEGGIRVPLIARWPGQIPANTVSPHLVHSVDFYPTLLQLAGNQWSPDPDEHPLDGESFADVLLDPNSDRHRAPIHYLFPGYLDVRAQPSIVTIGDIGDQRFKLWYDYEGDDWTLYHLDEDLHEQTDSLSSHPESAAALAQHMNQWLTQDHPTWKPRFPILKESGTPAGPPNTP